VLCAAVVLALLLGLAGLVLVDCATERVVALRTRKLKNMRLMEFGLCFLNYDGFENAIERLLIGRCEIQFFKSVLDFGNSHEKIPK
jgi:hypothetical protein